jgi:hypothetical protein
MNDLDDLEIEPLSDAALESVAGGKSSDGDNCCSCRDCSNDVPPKEVQEFYA